MTIKLKRRTVLLGGIGGAAVVAAGLKPRDRGENHSPYFTGLSAALDAAPAVGPTLVVDRHKMLAQVEQLCATGTVTTVSGSRITLSADTLCVHGDNPEGVEAIREIRALVDGG